MNDPRDLHAYVDGELTKEEAAHLRAMIDADPRILAELNSILNLKDCLREKTPKVSCEVTWANCRSRFVEIERSRRVDYFVGRHAWSICGAFLVFLVSARFLVQGVQGDSVRTADLSRAFTGLVSRSAPKSQTQPEVDRWLDSLLGQTKPLISCDQMRVISGASTPYGLGQAARIDLVDRSGPLTLIVVPETLKIQDAAVMPGNPPVAAGEMGGRNCIAWTISGHTLLLCAGRPYEDLQIIASRIVLE